MSSTESIPSASIPNSRNSVRTELRIVQSVAITKTAGTVFGWRSKDTLLVATFRDYLLPSFPANALDNMTAISKPPIPAMTIPWKRWKWNLPTRSNK
jgi:hypothetical protein